MHWELLGRIRGAFDLHSPATFWLLRATGKDAGYTCVLSVLNCCLLWGEADSFNRSLVISVLR